MEQTQLLTARELAIRLRVKTCTVNQWARLGRIPAIRVTPKVIRYNLRDVLGAIAAAQKSEVRRG